jgi:hypothetical protein
MHVSPVLYALLALTLTPLACHALTNNDTHTPRIPVSVTTPLSNSTEKLLVALDPSLLHDAYTSTFRLRDGSSLLSVNSAALDAMRGSVQRLLAVGKEVDWLTHTRSLPDDRLVRILLLAVAGNFTVDQSPSAIPQRCGIVVDPGSGALVLRDNAAAQSVILEVLLIVSIVCLVRAWGGANKETSKS